MKGISGEGKKQREREGLHGGGEGGWTGEERSRWW